VIHSATPVPGALSREPTLEESYSAFLALEGVAAPAAATEEGA
jgi:hypothetical protein